MEERGVTMDKCEIVKAAINHRETQRIPYCVDFTEEALKRIRRHFPGRDFQLAIGNYVYQVSPPWWNWHNVPENYGALEEPDYIPQTIGRGDYEGLFEKCRKIKETTGCYILAMFYGSHFEKAWFARGIDNFLYDLAGNHDYAKRMLEIIIRKNMVMLENMLCCEDIDGVLLGSDWGSQKSMLMSPACWRELLAPGEKQEYDLIHAAGKDVWVHSCGCIEAILPDLIEMGVNVLNPLQPECMDIFEIKRKYGDKLAFWGGISTQRTLPLGTPADVIRETREVITAMSKGGGYIAAPAQAIQEDVPVKNILALMDELRKH